MIVHLFNFTIACHLALARPTDRLPFHSANYGVNNVNSCSIAGLKGTLTDQTAYRYTFKYANRRKMGAAKISQEPTYVLENSDDGLRISLEKTVTDGVWRCPNRVVARVWAKAGGDVRIGEWEDGVTYSTNQGTYCQAQGRVCHEDDILPAFGAGTGSLVRVNSGSLAKHQDAVTDRWASFIMHLDPNYTGVRGGGRSLNMSHVQQEGVWEKYNSGQFGPVYALGSGEVVQCPRGWGGDIPYDWQLYP